MSNPYESPESEVSLPDNQRPYEYVGFWARFVASLIDTVLLMAMVAPILFTVFGSDYFLQSEADFSAVGAIINYLLPALAVMVFWKYKSATPGKLVIKAVIIDAKTGDKLSNVQIIGRYLGYYVSAIPFGLGLLWVGWDKKKQGFHDKLAGTLVVRYINESNDD